MAGLADTAHHPLGECAGRFLLLCSSSSSSGAVPNALCSRCSPPLGSELSPLCLSLLRAWIRVCALGAGLAKPLCCSSHQRACSPHVNEAAAWESPFPGFSPSGPCCGTGCAGVEPFKRWQCPPERSSSSCVCGLCSYIMSSRSCQYVFPLLRTQVVL